MYGAIKQHLAAELKSIEEAGLFKKERIITTPQDAVIKLADGSEVVNFCANNYLGLSSHPRVVEAAKRAIDTHGFGMSSVRFICGTQDIHKELEAKIAEFYGTEDTILYAAAFDANGGVFEPLLGEKDAIISDALNHASIIDGIRLCKSMRYRYEHNAMEDLEAKLKQAAIDKGEYDARYARLVSGAQNDLDLQRSILEQKKANDDEYYANALANENLTADQIRELNDSIIVLNGIIQQNQLTINQIKARRNEKVTAVSKFSSLDITKFLSERYKDSIK